MPFGSYLVVMWVFFMVFGVMPQDRVQYVLGGGENSNVQENVLSIRTHAGNN